MSKKPNKSQIESSGKYYSEEGLWDKMSSVAKNAGIKTIYMALLLYHTVISPSTPLKYRTIIFGALGYFILPIDLVPDLLPVIGYTDDIAALAAAIAAVSTSITPAIRHKAKDQLHRWFGDYDENEISGI